MLCYNFHTKSFCIFHTHHYVQFQCEYQVHFWLQRFCHTGHMYVSQNLYAFLDDNLMRLSLQKVFHTHYKQYAHVLLSFPLTKATAFLKDFKLSNYVSHGPHLHDTKLTSAMKDMMEYLMF